VQLLEGVLHHVLGGGQVAYYQQRQPDKVQVVRTEQLRDIRCRNGPVGPVTPIRRRVWTDDDVSFHT
jgi:hypothetical protein